MWKVSLIISLIILSCKDIAAADPRPVPMDTGQIILTDRSIPQSHIAEYTKLPEYSYRKSILYETNIFKRYWNSFKRWVSDLFGLASDTGIGTVLFYLIIGLAVLGLVYHLMRSTYNSPFQKKAIETLDEEAIIINQDGSEKILEKKINEYETTGDLRQALRYRFILSVWTLDNKGVINWQPEMTNYQILKLISSPQIKTAFRNLVSIYEHIWYGHYPIESENQYLSYRKIFNSFSDKIQLLS